MIQEITGLGVKIQSDVRWRGRVDPVAASGSPENEHGSSAGKEAGESYL